jgi:glycerate 2-kinase
VAAGKAAAGMLRGAAAFIPAGSRSIVLLPRGADTGGLPASTVVLRGGHPHPTSEGILATRRIGCEIDGLGAGDHLLFLVSGGASALLEAPAPGIDEADVVRVHEILVASGLAIAEINLVRGCLSAVKAGRLAERARPARVTTLAVSDVEGDDPRAIGSGPTAAPLLARSEAASRALLVLRERGVVLPVAVVARLERDAAGNLRDERGRDDDDFTVVASIGQAVSAARTELERRGYVVAAVSEYLKGDTAAAAARILRALGDRAAADDAVVLGGETTVAVGAGAAGRGGRNLDLAARLALAIAGREDVAVVVAGTDGCDGSSRAAGAVVDGGTACRAERSGFPLGAALAAFDTEPALEASGDLVVTGPTGTNVGDLVVAVRRRAAGGQGQGASGGS